jgi:hypothetical protein
MTTRAWGVLLAVAGAVLLVISAFADPLGIGGTDDFGWKQLVGVIVGAVALVGGIGLVYMPQRGEVEPGGEE